MAKEMFGSSDKRKSVTKEVNRGTQDEMEIVMMIVAQNLSIKQAVLEKIRQTKYRLGMSAKATQGQENAQKKAK